jgi:hypothetical protein
LQSDGSGAAAAVAAAIPAAREWRGNGRKAMRRLYLWLTHEARYRA